jgi:hypothetical protein
MNVKARWWIAKGLMKYQELTAGHPELVSGSHHNDKEMLK